MNQGRVGPKLEAGQTRDGYKNAALVIEDPGYLARPDTVEKVCVYSMPTASQDIEIQKACALDVGDG